MNADDFEQQLKRQPLRPPPAEWRAEILAVAEARASLPATEQKAGGPRGLSLHGGVWEMLRTSMSALRLSSLLWPGPAAWAGLAAIWLAIFALNMIGADRSAKGTKAAAPSREVMLALREQQRELARLLETAGVETIAGQPTKFRPSPRSQRAQAHGLG